jgi:competence protein ComEC
MIIGTLLLCAHETKIEKANRQKEKLVALLEEPLVEKRKSFKAICSTISDNQKKKFIVYFEKTQRLKDSVGYGSAICFEQPLQPIRNSGNPGSFKYDEYCLRQGISHQVYLSAGNYKILPLKDERWWRRWIFNCRRSVVDLIQHNIEGKEEQGLAEALLIGYKDDLDRTLVSAYSNTGVVHVIAISGLHLGIIYTILLFLTRPLEKRKLFWSRFLLVVAGLWIFSFIAGAQASVLRSAIMFTFIAAGTLCNRRSPIINTLALSALVLLCWDPYLMWDVGFQLSYTAVLSLVLFFKPVYNWLFIRNKFLDQIWKLSAVTISAQILTLPLTIYYFHQFPLLILLTNLIAIPLSTIILIGEILLVAFSWWPLVSSALGWIITIIIRWMNQLICFADDLNLVLSGLVINKPQVLLLYLFTGSLAVYFLQQKKKWSIAGFLFLMIFLLIRTHLFSKAETQTGMVVYNIPKKTAIDIFQDRNAVYIGDTIDQEEISFNYNIQPCRLLYRISNVRGYPVRNVSFILKDHLLLVATSGWSHSEESLTSKLVVVTSLAELPSAAWLAAFKGKVVIDASVPKWKTTKWKQCCDKEKISYHHVLEEGAFVLKL